MYVEFRELNRKKSDKNKNCIGKAVKIDEDGMFITSDIELEEGSLVNLKIFLEKKSIPLILEGKVIWLASKRVISRDIKGMQIEFYYKNWQDYICLKRKISGKKSFINILKDNKVLLIFWTVIILIIVILAYK